MYDWPLEECPLCTSQSRLSIVIKIGENLANTYSTRDFKNYKGAQLVSGRYKRPEGRLNTFTDSLMPDFALWPSALYLNRLSSVKLLSSLNGPVVNHSGDRSQFATYYTSIIHRSWASKDILFRSLTSCNHSFTAILLWAYTPSSPGSSALKVLFHLENKLFSICLYRGWRCKT